MTAVALIVALALTLVLTFADGIVLASCGGLATGFIAGVLAERHRTARPTRRA